LSPVQACCEAGWGVGKEEFRPVSEQVRVIVTELYMRGEVQRRKYNAYEVLEEIHARGIVPVPSRADITKLINALVIAFVTRVCFV
jgi:hypothetical protein